MIPPDLVTLQSPPTPNTHLTQLKRPIQDPLRLNHGLEMAVQQRALRHLTHNLPQLALLHPLLGQREHHTRIHVRAWVRLGHDLVLVLARP